MSVREQIEFGIGIPSRRNKRAEENNIQAWFKRLASGTFTVISRLIGCVGSNRVIPNIHISRSVAMTLKRRSYRGYFSP